MVPHHIENLRLAIRTFALCFSHIVLSCSSRAQHQTGTVDRRYPPCRTPGYSLHQNNPQSVETANF